VVPRRLIDDADGRILRTLFAAGFPDRAGYRNRGPRATTPARRAAARTVAERGMVLLRNRRGALPLDGTVRSLAVIGDAARAFEVGGGSSQVDPVTSVTPLVGIRARARGRARVSFTRGTSPAAAARAARRADAAVVVVSDDSSEFEDKTGIALADGDPACTGGDFGACGPPPARNADALVRAVAAANPRTVVVLETGGPVLLPWAGRVSAILEAWYPGQEGGSALARVLWGDVDPSGRLPQTFPRRPGDLAVHTRAQFPGVRGRARYSEGIFVGYRHFDRAGIRPLYAFGHGGPTPRSPTAACAWPRRADGGCA
jgi:beta-glucosidase